MTKKVYFRQLRLELKSRGVENYNEIVDDYIELYDQKISEGSSSEEIFAQWGSPSNIANEYKQVKFNDTRNVGLFIALQVFNVLIAVWLIVGLASIAISLIAASFATVVALFVGAITSVIHGIMPMWALALFIMLSVTIIIFIVTLAIIVTKFTYKATYNYVVYNINLLKTHKVRYLKIREKKSTVIALISSFCFTVILIIVAATLGVSYDFESQFNANGEMIVEDYDFDEEIQHLDIDAKMDVIIERGSENSIEINSYDELDVIFDNNTITIDNDFKWNRFIDVDFFKFIYEEDEYIKIIVTEDLETIYVNGIDVVIDNVVANSYNVDTVNLDFELKDATVTDIDVDTVGGSIIFEDVVVKSLVNLDVTDFSFSVTGGELDAIEADAVDLDLYLVDTIVNSIIDIDAVNTYIDIIDSEIADVEVDSVDVELVMDASEAGEVDISDAVDGGFSATNSKVKSLKVNAFQDLEIDSKSNVNIEKED